MKKTTKKLVLTRETLRSLKGEEMGEVVAGGTFASWFYPCVPHTMSFAEC